MSDLTNVRYGRWVVLGYSGPYKFRGFSWLCRCVCGVEKIVPGANLQNGQSKSCGCLQREKASEQARVLTKNRPSGVKDVSGQRFGRLLVQKMAGLNKHRSAIWSCQCDCGGQTEVSGISLRDGNTRSCGCLVGDTVSKIHTKHGKSHTKEYHSWFSAKSRCLNSKDPQFFRYGARGIKMCEAWLTSFETFYKDMGDASPGLTLDRIDNNGNYEPGNCRWATKSQQSQNSRWTKLLSFQGETLCKSEWARRIGISPTALNHRLLTKTLEEALTAPRQNSSVPLCYQPENDSEGEINA